MGCRDSIYYLFMDTLIFKTLIDAYKLPEDFKVHLAIFMVA